MYQKISLFCASMLLSLSAVAQLGSISGKITNFKTGEPLANARILIVDTPLGAVSDEKGNYTIENIPPKTYNIKASYVGFSPLTRYNIIIRSEGNLDYNFQLKEQAYELDELVITPNSFRKLQETPLSIQSLNQEEVATYPGGNNDISKVVQSLPGVSGSIGGFRNDVIIRGGGPSENVYYLDGIEIPNINHFATQGSAGGPVGLLNVSFFEGVSLLSSSFGAQYDNALSGVLQFDQRKGNGREFRGNARLGASEAGITLEGPLFKKDQTQSKLRFIISARRSYLQFLFELIGLPFLPDYWDYQYKVSYDIDPYNELILTGVGSIDNFEVNELDEFDPDQQAIQEQVPVIVQRTNIVGFIWKNRFKDGSGLMQTAISSNRLENTFSQFDDNVNQEGLFFENEALEQETKLRFRLTKFIGDWTTTYGSSVQYVNYENRTTDLVNNFDFNSALNFVRYGFFAQASTNLLNGKLSVTAGFRMDGNTFMNNGNDVTETFSPRVSLSYPLTQNEKLRLNASLGRYYRIPFYTVLGFRDNNGNTVNEDAEYIRTDHYVVGTEYLLSESARISVEGFVKLYDQYPVSILDSISIANQGGGFEVLGSEPVESVGRGRTYGAEFLFQQKFNGQFYAILSYTLFWSEFTGFDREEFLPSAWDNRHIISLTGAYKLRNNWEISSRYRYQGSAPFAPVDEEATLVNYPALIFDFSRFGDVRLDAFTQLDVRVDKKWNFKSISLDLYLDIQNILAAEIPEPPRFGLSRDDTGEVLQPEQLVITNTDDSGDILPTIGILLNF